MSALEAFRDAVAAGNQEEALDLASSVFDELDAESERERGVELAARSVATDGTRSKSELQAANDVTESILATESARTSLAYSVIEIAQGRFDREATLETVDAILDSQDRVDSAVDSLRESGAVERLDPILVAFTTGNELELPKGTAGTASVTVQNSGGRAAEPVTVDADAPTGVDVSPTRVDELAGGDTTTVEVSFPASLDAGRHAARLTVDAPAASPSSAAVAAAVLSKAEYAERAISSLDDLEERIAGLLEERNRPSRPFDNRIRTLQRDLQSGIDVVGSSEKTSDDGNPNGNSGTKNGNSNGKKNRNGRSPDHHFERALDHLNGLLGLINSLQAVEDGVRASLRSDVEAIEASIENAIAADE